MFHEHAGPSGDLIFSLNLSRHRDSSLVQVRMKEKTKSKQRCETAALQLCGRGSAAWARPRTSRATTMRGADAADTGGVVS